MKSGEIWRVLGKSGEISGGLGKSGRSEEDSELQRVLGNLKVWGSLGRSGEGLWKSGEVCGGLGRLEEHALEQGKER